MYFSSRLTLVLALCATVAPLSATARIFDNNQSTRLDFSEQVRRDKWYPKLALYNRGALEPVKYNVKLEIKEPQFPFGSDPLLSMSTVTIQVRCAANIDGIFLHTKQSEVDPDSVRIIETATGTPVFVGAVETDNVHGLVRILVPAGFKEGSTYEITMESYYRSQLDNPTGLSWSVYQTLDDKNSYTFSKSSGPAQLRYLFPCFDEPEYPAVFSFEVVVFQSSYDLIPLTNARPLTYDDKSVQYAVVYKFEDTPRMVPDAVQFSVIPLQWYEGPRGTPL